MWCEECGEEIAEADEAAAVYCPCGDVFHEGCEEMHNEHCRAGL